MSVLPIQLNASHEQSKVPLENPPKKHASSTLHKIAIPVLKFLSGLLAVVAAGTVFVTANLAIIGILPVSWAGLVSGGAIALWLGVREGCHRMEQVLA